MEAETIVREMADDTGHISPTTPDSEGADDREIEIDIDIDIDIDIRQDGLKMFETASGRQLLQTDEMDAGVFIEPVPSENGFVPEIVTNPDADLSETSPADRAEQPDVEQSVVTDIIIMD